MARGEINLDKDTITRQKMDTMKNFRVFKYILDFIIVNRMISSAYYLADRDNRFMRDANQEIRQRYAFTGNVFNKP